MPSRDKISVVIPAYNAEDTIGPALESVLAQTLPPFEVIVVDDGSTDATPSIVAAFGPRVRMLTRSNGGIAAARNAGHGAVGGDLVAWLDADDLARPERLEVQAAVLAAEPAAVIVGTDFDTFGDGGQPASRFARAYYGAIGPEGSLDRILGSAKSLEAAGRSWRYHCGVARTDIVFGNFLHPPTVMMRASAVAEAGPLVDTFPTSEDWLYFVAIARLGQVAFVDEPLLDYRLSTGQMSRRIRTVRTNNLRSLEYFLAGNPEFAAAHPVRVRAALASHRVALADHLAESSARAALPHLLGAIRRGAPARAVTRAAIKMLLPTWLARSIRRLRGRVDLAQGPGEEAPASSQ